MHPIETPHLAALARLREHLEQCWHWTHSNYIAHGQRFFLEKRTTVPDRLSTGMCRHSTLFLLEELARAGDTTWRVAGGFLNEQAHPGVYDQSGSWIRHWWLESADAILDLTADQAGWEPVVLARLDDARYARQEKLSKKSMVSNLKGTVAQWRGEGASFWQEAAPAFQKIARDARAVLPLFAQAWRAAEPAPPAESPAPVRSMRRPS